MTVDIESPSPSGVSPPAERSRTPGLLALGWDALARFFDDHANAILAKEVRQAFKSGGFQSLFVVLLVVAWGYTLLAISWGDPSSGAGLFIGYYFILNLALLVGVPFQALSSMSSDVEVQTYELLSITAIRPWQIVVGKLLVATIQMIVLLAALAPCLLFTYLLGGVSVPMVVLSLGWLLTASLLLSQAALLIGSVQVALVRWMANLGGFLLMLYFGIMWAFFAIEEGDRLAAEILASPHRWTILAFYASSYASLFILLAAATTANLTFPADNRSTRVRLAILLVLTNVLGWSIYYALSEGGGVTVAAILSIVLLWVTGALMTGESPLMSRRVRRGLPGSQLGNALIGLFFPGPGRGYVFTVCGIAAVLVFYVSASTYSREPVSQEWFLVATILACHATIYLGLGLLVMRWLMPAEKRNVWAGLVVQALLLGTLGLVPVLISINSPMYSTARGWEWLSPFGLYSVNSNPGAAEAGLWAMVGAALVVVGLNLLAGAGTEMRLTRLQKPARLVEEEQRLHPPKPTPPASPWD